MLRRLHRYLGLVLAALWLLQAATGVLLVFRWELDDASASGPAGPLDIPAFAAGLERLQARYPLAPVQAYASGGAPGRFDVLVEAAPGRLDDVKLDGRGETLRQRPWNYDLGGMGVFTLAGWLHDDLFAGTVGAYLVGLSGLVMLSSIAAGLKLAWPRPGFWRRALWPAPVAGLPRRLFGWHRALGLWGGAVAAVLALTGAGVAFDTPLRAALHAEHAAAPTWAPPPGPPVAAARALRIGFGLYPQAQLYSLVLPSAAQPWYRIGLRQPGEVERFAGQTTLYLGRDGRVLGGDDALRDPLRVRAMDALYAIHTGEIAGLPGRLLSLAGGVALMGLIVLGVWLWLARFGLTRYARDPGGRRRACRRA